jgi:signal transduction histidine kinase/GAF domain-containing protein
MRAFSTLYSRSDGYMRGPDNIKGDSMETRVHTPTVKESTIVERVARIVSSVRGNKPDYTRLAAELEPALPFDVFGVVLLRHDRQAVRVTVCHKERDIWIAQCHQHPFAGSMVEQMEHLPVALIANYPIGLDGPPATCGDALSNHHHLHATLIAPLVAGERVLGTLELGSTALNTYADKTLQRLIEAVVHVLATAIESAQMGGSAEIQDRQRQALKDVSSALTSRMDLSAILDQIVHGVANALNVASAIITLDQREGSLRLAAQSGLEPLILGKIVAKKVTMPDQTIVGYTLRRQQPCVSQDISNDERFPASRVFMTELGMRSVSVYPLVTGTTVYGALLLCSPEPGGFTPLKADILSLFASQATIAIHNAMLIESAHQRSRFQKAIEQLEQAYAQNDDEQEILMHVRQEAERTFGISFSSLLHFISDHLLTRNERDLQAILHTTQHEEQAEHAPASLSSSLEQEVAATLPRPWQSAQESGTSDLPFLAQDSVGLLTQTAETALARAEVLSEWGRFSSQLKQSAGHMKDAWFVVDLHGLCMYMNPAAEVFCGMLMGLAVENTITDIFSELLPRMRNKDEVKAYLYEFRQGNVYRRTIRCILAAEPIKPPQTEAHTLRAHTSIGVGESRKYRNSLHEEANNQYYELSHHPLFNQQGTLLANVLQVHDVTAQVHDDHNKAALLSSVSHDLRTPLTTIKAAVTGLLQIGVDWNETTRREILEEIDAETDHLGVLIGALIELSRIEMGALVLDKEWCDIAEVLHGALIRLERILVGQHVRTSILPQLPLIYADHAQLERVFYNLIENVVRQNASNADILVTIDALVEDVDEASFTSLRVKITGRYYALPLRERERIFRSFSGLHARGGGLGLAICGGIVEAHQGQIGVEATCDGQGLSFIFTLPVHPHHGVSSVSVGGNHTLSSAPCQQTLPTTEE